MFITKKKFQEEINKAVEEHHRSIVRDRQFEELYRDMSEQYNRVHRRIDELEIRLHSEGVLKSHENGCFPCEVR